MRKYVNFYRIPEEFVTVITDMKGATPIELVSLYSRKQQRFIQLYERAFKPYTRGGITECRIVDDNGNEFFGYAVCSLSDNFCYKIGRELAHERAYKNFIDNVPY